MGVDDMSHASGFHPEIDVPSSPLPSSPPRPTPHHTKQTIESKDHDIRPNQETHMTRERIFNVRDECLAHPNHLLLPDECTEARDLWTGNRVSNCGLVLKESAVTTEAPHNLPESDVSQEESCLKSEAQVEQIMRQSGKADLGVKSPDSCNSRLQSTDTSCSQSSSSLANVCKRRRLEEHHQSKGSVVVVVSRDGSPFPDARTHENCIPASVDLMICGVCRSLFTSLPLFLRHKKSNSCRLRFVCHCRTRDTGSGQETRD